MVASSRNSSSRLTRLVAMSPSGAPPVVRVSNSRSMTVCVICALGTLLLLRSCRFRARRLRERIDGNVLVAHFENLELLHATWRAKGDTIAFLRFHQRAR